MGMGSILVRLARLTRESGKEVCFSFFLCVCGCVCVLRGCVEVGLCAFVYIMHVTRENGKQVCVLLCRVCVSVDAYVHYGDAWELGYIRLCIL